MENAPKPSVIKEGRELKKEAREREINLSGKNPEGFGDIQSKLEQIIADSIEKNREWLEQEWQKLVSKLGSDPAYSFEKFVETFQSTLEKRIKMIARLGEIPANEIVEEEDWFAPIFDQAVFDFIMSIRKSGNRGDTLLQTLDLAGLSHWLNPNEIERLSKKYLGRVDPSAIKQAAISHPRGPDQFLDSCLVETERLVEKYPQIDLTAIKHAAIHYTKNPDKYLDWFAYMMEYLMSERPNLKKYEITALLMARALGSKKQLLDML